MHVRPLTASDAAQYSKLRREQLQQDPVAFAESLSEHDAKSLQSIAMRLGSGSGDNFVIGAFSEDGELTGSAGFARNSRVKSRHKGMIWGVYVSPPWRGRGIAKAIFSELLSRARAEPGLEQIMLTVSTGQEAARRLYTSLGFEVFARERHALKVDDEYVDEDYMVLWLT